MNGGSPIVRPWLKAGLNVLLIEDEERALALRAAPESEPSAPGQPEARPAMPPRPQMPRQPSPQSPAPQSPAPNAPRRTPVQAMRAPMQNRGERPQPVAPAAQPAARPAPKRDAASLLAAPGALPVERWPASWLALRDRRPLPPRPLVLWSYAGLGDDLVGTPDEARRRVIVRMLTELRHPAGTHVFWPFVLPGEEPSAEASLFWSGVRMLDPRVLLLFGSDTRDALAMPKTLLPFCQARVHGRLVIQLPRPQALAVDESAFRQAQAFLSRILRFCASR